MSHSRKKASSGSSDKKRRRVVRDAPPSAVTSADTAPVRGGSTLSLKFSPEFTRYKKASGKVTTE
ncbi:MAG TPA: hypothetical protein VKE50_07005 [Thermoanaerobaculia bacterium]|nr:hypothetical protein [Thermoanaerobaculia bacterium]